MIFKKGSRAAVRQVEVPADSKLATYSRERAEAMQIERKQLKRLVRYTSSHKFDSMRERWPLEKNALNLIIDLLLVALWTGAGVSV